MRVCYDYQAFAGRQYGGIARYFVEIASRIRGYPGTSARIVAPLYRSKLLAEKAELIPVVGVPFTYDIRGAAKVIQRIDSSLSRVLSIACRPNIVHETYHTRERTSSLSAKTVLTVHDLIEELFPRLFPQGQKTIAIRKEAFRRADHLICVSENTRRDLISLYGIDSEKTSVVYLASSLTRTEPAIAEAREPFFLYVGNRSGYKNFLGLLAAFAESLLFKTHILVCFGGGRLTPIEQEQIRMLKIPSDRVVSSRGDDERLSCYYASAEAFVCPSLYEGFGIPLLEAMNCGCPILCGSSGSMPEVAGEAAIHFDASDTGSISNAMLKVVESRETRRRLILRGEARAKQFSWDTCAKQTYDVYKRLLAEG